MSYYTHTKLWSGACAMANEGLQLDWPIRPPLTERSGHTSNAISQPAKSCARMCPSGRGFGLAKRFAPASTPDQSLQDGCTMSRSHRNVERRACAQRGFQHQAASRPHHHSQCQGSPATVSRNPNRWALFASHRYCALLRSCEFKSRACPLWCSLYLGRAALFPLLQFLFM